MQLEYVLIGLFPVDFSMPVRLKGERILHKHECLHNCLHSFQHYKVNKMITTKMKR